MTTGKDDPMPMKFVDYIDIMPGGSYKRPSAEERKRLKVVADSLKEIAQKHGVTFKVTKGDES